MTAAAEKKAAQPADDTIHFSEAFAPAETFDAPVNIPVLGKDPVKVKMTFETMEPDAYMAALKEDVPLIEFLGERVKAWDAKVMGCKYSADALAAFCKRQHGAANAILDAYQRALITGRVGN